MPTKLTTVRITLDGERFEILVNPDNALNFRLGRNIDLSQVVAVDEIYTDASKGQRAPSDKLNKHFKTIDSMEVAEMILARGELQLMSDQRRHLIDEKKKQIINLICREYVDPRTSIRHPPLRIEQAMNEARLSIDPFTDAVEQVKLVTERLRTILPLKSENLNMSITVSARYVAQTMGVLKRFGTIQKQDWGSDGSLTALLEIPAGVHPELLDKLGSVTKGSAQSSILK